MRTIKSLIIGDIVGKPGCRALFIGLAKIVQKTGAEIVIANGENATEGRGISPEDMKNLFQSGVKVITSGNHIWQKKDIYPFLESEDFILRPENYPRGVLGKGHCIAMVKGIKVGVCNLQGRVFLSDTRCPFKVGRETILKMRKETNILIVDFHAESPEEKEALAIYLDGKVSALIGTHTHIQTADERILSGGTAYLTDAGMTGPVDTIIGMGVGTAIRRSLTQMPLTMEVEEREAEINGVLVEIDVESGHALSIERIRERSAV